MCEVKGLNTVYTLDTMKDSAIESGIPEWIYRWAKTTCIGETGMMVVPVGESLVGPTTIRVYITNPYRFSGLDSNEEIRKVLWDTYEDKKPMGIIWVGRDVAVVDFTDPDKSLMSNDPALIGKHPR